MCVRLGAICAGRHGSADLILKRWPNISAAHSRSATRRQRTGCLRRPHGFVTLSVLIFARPKSGRVSRLSDPMPPDPFDHLWNCAYCDARFVIPTLARDCERIHESEAMRDASTEPRTDRPRAEGASP